MTAVLRGGHVQACSETDSRYTVTRTLFLLPLGCFCASSSSSTRRFPLAALFDGRGPAGEAVAWGERSAGLPSEVLRGAVVLLEDTAAGLETVAGPDGSSAGRRKKERKSLTWVSRCSIPLAVSRWEFDSARSSGLRLWSSRPRPAGFLRL